MLELREHPSNAMYVCVGESSACFYAKMFYVDSTGE